MVDREFSGMQDDNSKVEVHGKQQGEPRKRRRRQQRPKRKWYVTYAIVAGLLVVSLLVGLAIGYVGMGHGKWSEVFSFSTYKHIYDLVFKNT
jgi:hypothetical protein